MPDRTQDLEMRLLVEAIYQRFHFDFRGYSSASLKRRLTAATTDRRLYFGIHTRTSDSSFSTSSGLAM